MQEPTTSEPKRISLTQQVHHCVARHLTKGEWVVDATCGNGHDTTMLAQLVGKTGAVYGFDVQQQALTNTESQLEGQQLSQRVTLFHSSHQRMRHHLPVETHGNIALAMFNLGYLPGGDKQLTTVAESTIEALEQALSLLKPQGALSIVVYPGHPAGAVEAQRVQQWSQQLMSEGYELNHVRPPKGKRPPPEWFWIKTPGEPACNAKDN